MTKRFPLFIILYMTASSILTRCTNSQDAKVGSSNLSRADDLTCLSGDRGQTIQLQQDLTIGDDGDTAIFGEIGTIDVDSKGRIYVHDKNVQRVAVFSETGKLLKAIGRKGQGPGEFEDLRNLDIGLGDSLFTFDSALRRISVFAPGDSNAFAYQIRVPRSENTSPTNLIGSTSEGFLMLFSPSFTSNDPEVKRTGRLRITNHLRMISHKGNFVGNSIITAIPGKEFIFVWYGGSVAMSPMPMPLARESVLRLGPDERLFYGYNALSSIKIYSLQGTPVDTILVETKLVDIIRSDLDSVLTSYKRNPLLDELGKSIAKTMPDTWPAFEDFIVDNRGRLWVNVFVNDRSISCWYIFDQKGHHVATVPLSADVNLKVICEQYAYGIETDKSEAQKIVRYHIVND